MRQFWRQWLRSPKHGVARGVAGFHGSPGFRNDIERLTGLLADCRELRAWAREHEADLSDSPDSLAALDHALNPASEDARRIRRTTADSSSARSSSAISRTLDGTCGPTGPR